MVCLHCVTESVPTLCYRECPYLVLQSVCLHCVTECVPATHVPYACDTECVGTHFITQCRHTMFVIVCLHRVTECVPTLSYGVASVRRIDKIIGLFSKRAL